MTHSENSNDFYVWISNWNKKPNLCVLIYVQPWVFVFFLTLYPIEHYKWFFLFIWLICIVAGFVVLPRLNTKKTKRTTNRYFVVLIHWLFVLSLFRDRAFKSRRHASMRFSCNIEITKWNISCTYYFYTNFRVFVGHYLESPATHGMLRWSRMLQQWDTIPWFTTPTSVGSSGVTGKDRDTLFAVYTVCRLFLNDT